MTVTLCVEDGNLGWTKKADWIFSVETGSRLEKPSADLDMPSSRQPRGGGTAMVAEGPASNPKDRCMMQVQR